MAFFNFAINYRSSNQQRNTTGISPDIHERLVVRLDEAKHPRRVYTPRMPVITGERYSDPSTMSYPDAIFSARTGSFSIHRRSHAELHAFFSPFSTASARDRHVPHAHANRVVDRVGNRRRHHRRGRLADAARVIAGLDQLDVDLRNVSETNRRVVVEVALLDRTVLQAQPFREHLTCAP